MQPLMTRSKITTKSPSSKKKSHIYSHSANRRFRHITKRTSHKIWTRSSTTAHITNYGKAIKTSIRQCNEQSIAHTRTIDTYHGFQRIILHPIPAPLANQPGNQTHENAILPNDPPQIHPMATIPARHHVQQSILATFRRRRTFQEILTQPPQALTPGLLPNPTINTTL